jgi:hypothetical protein
MSLYRGYFVPQYVDPTGEFLGHVYGRYCGFSRNGPGKPIDELDAACKEHDRCLATWSLVWNEPCRIPICNENLCAAADDAINRCTAWHPEPSKALKDCLAYANKILDACDFLGHKSPYQTYPDANGDGTPDIIGPGGCCKWDSAIGSGDPKCGDITESCVL